MHKDSTAQQDVTKDCHNITEAEIDTTLKDSFPASDPPSWTLGTAPCADTSEEDTEQPGDEGADATNQEQDAAASSMKNRK